VGMSDPIPTVRNPLRYRCQFGIGSRSGAYAALSLCFFVRAAGAKGEIAGGDSELRPTSCDRGSAVYMRTCVARY
jgi:hypothetical protein